MQGLGGKYEYLHGCRRSGGLSLPRNGHPESFGAKLELPPAIDEDIVGVVLLQLKHPVIQSGTLV